MIDIRLYIDGQRADLDSDSLIVLSYTLDDTTNPTIVKNSFSKSITIPSTKNNDAIFGTMRSIRTRITLGRGFSPLVRTPFQLFSNGELIESGYVQLNEVVTKAGVATYKITLFGGLGDFFYNLMYDADGEKRTLADLDYGIEGAIDSESEMDFNISKEVVNASWDSVGSGRNFLAEAITFVPAYNGLGSDYDNEHALVNSNGLAGSLPTTYSDGGKTYTLYNGYGLAELQQPLTEWEVRDLRSYRQRPALSVRMLMQALANPANNGGYEVVLDSNFFNEENTLYHDAYITLPMLGGERSDEEASIDLGITDITLGEDITVDTSSTAFYTLPSSANNAQIKVSMPITLRLQSAQNKAPILYDSITQIQPTSIGAVPYYVNSWIVVQAEAQDGAGNVVGVSSIYSFATSMQGFTSYLAANQIDGYTPLNNEGVGYTRVQGEYTLTNGEYIFLDALGNNTFPIELSFFRGSTSSIRVALRVQRVFTKSWGEAFGAMPKADIYFSKNSYQSLTLAYYDGVQCKGDITALVTDAGATVDANNLPAIASGSKVTKRTLLTTDATPADYLLSYAKLFGLRFIRDKYDKKITITKDSYFTGRIHDITQRIDRDSDIKVTPNVFDKRIMRLALDTPETYYSRKYKDAQGVDYAQKRVDTGYGFNADVEEVYKDNVFTTAVPCRAVSPAYNHFYDVNGNEMPSIFAYNFNYALANRDATPSADKFDTFGELQQTSANIAPTRTTPFFATKSYDALPKMCYFEQKDGKQESVDIANNLVVFCGRVVPKDSAGNAITYWLTDDLPEMLKLNGKVCHLVTQSETSRLSDNIAIALTRLPQFLSIRLINNQVYDSFEMAVSKENYLGESITYAEEQTLYGRFWQRYYEDRMDVNTRIVECMVNFDGVKVDADALRDFYFFDDAYWLLNKIVDYSPQSMKLTKCQFVKIRNLSTYANITIDGEGSSEGFVYALPINLTEAE